MTSDVYDVYGIKLKFEEAKNVTAVALGVEFVEHESGYLGGTYLRAAGPPPENFLLIRNVGDEESIPFLRYAEYPVLLQVNATRRSASIRDALCSAVPDLALLETREFG